MKPEQQFFKDPVVERLMGVVMALAGEVYIVKDRERALEQVLVEKGLISGDAVESFRPSAELQAAWAKDRDAYVSRIFESLIRGGEASSHVDHVLVKELTTPAQA